MMIKKLLRITLRLIAALLILMVGGVAFLLLRPTSLDFGWLRSPIDRQLTELLGREITISGDIVLVTGISPSLRVEAISVANPAGWEGGGQLAELERFQTTISLSELIRRRINIDDIEIKGLDLALELDLDGHGNWEKLATAGRSDNTAGSQPKSDPVDTVAGKRENDDSEASISNSPVWGQFAFRIFR